MLGIQDCRNCILHSNRTNVVEGEGSYEASIMLVGECPGPDEDRSGRPFVGRSGKLLRNLLDSIGVNTDKVYITNIVKCYPFHSLNPSQEHINLCAPYLREQIETIRPKIIASLGRLSSEFILGRKIRITRCSGSIIEGGYRVGALKADVLPILHPSYVLRGNLTVGDYALHFLPLLEF